MLGRTKSFNTPDDRDRSRDHNSTYSTHSTYHYMYLYIWQNCQFDSIQNKESIRTKYGQCIDFRNILNKFVKECIYYKYFPKHTQELSCTMLNGGGGGYYLWFI